MKKTALFLAVIMLVFMLASCAAKPVDDRVVMTLNGEKIYYDYFRYVFLNARDDIAMGNEEYWNENINAQVELQDNVLDVLVRNQAILELAEKYDIRLTKDEKNAVDEYVEAFLAEFGEGEELEEALDSAYMTEYTLHYLREVTVIWEKLYNYITDESSGIIKCSDDELLKDIPVNFRHYRYVVIYNDEEDDKNENLELALEIKNKAENGESFSELIKEYGEDENMEKRAESGYYYTVGEIVEDIANVVEDMNEGEISEVIDFSDAYFVIERMPIDNEYVEKNLEEFRESYNARIFNEMLDDMCKEIDVKLEELYHELNVFNVK